MTNEFHTINGQCATLVPQGSDYINFPAANKVCTVLGSMPGQTIVNGERFVELSFAYNQSHLWRVIFPCASTLFYQNLIRRIYFCRTLAFVLPTASYLLRSS